MDVLDLLQPLGFAAALAFTLRAAGGKLAPRMAIAPLVFLLTRVPLLACSVVGIVGTYEMLTRAAAANGKSPELLPLLGVSVICGLGFAALVVGPVFFAMRLFAAKPVFVLDDGETILERFAANHMLGREARGGSLLITERRLGFLPHRFNVQLAQWSLPLEQLRGVRTEGSRLLVLDTDQGEALLVVMHPDRLASQLLSLTETTGGSSRYHSAQA